MLGLVKIIKVICWLVATQIFFFFTPNLGEDSHFDEHIFQRGWFNHHVVIKVIWVGFIFVAISVGQRGK